MKLQAHWLTSCQSQVNERVVSQSDPPFLFSTKPVTAKTFIGRLENRALPGDITVPTSIFISLVKMKT